MRTKPPHVGRRSFVLNTGAALSGAITAAAVAGPAELASAEALPADERLAHLSHRLGVLEDMRTIRALHQAYADRVGNGRHEDVADLLAEHAEVRVNGEGTSAPVHTCVLNHFEHRDAIEIADDRQSATARFHCLVHAATPLNGESTIVAMAREQGQSTYRAARGYCVGLNAVDVSTPYLR